MSYRLIIRPSKSDAGNIAAGRSCEVSVSVILSKRFVRGMLDHLARNSSAQIQHIRIGSKERGGKLDFHQCHWERNLVVCEVFCHVWRCRAFGKVSAANKVGT